MVVWAGVAPPGTAAVQAIALARLGWLGSLLPGWQRSGKMEAREERCDLIGFFVSIMVIFSPFVGIFVYAGYLVMTTNPEQFSLLERGILLGVIVFVTAAFLFLIVFILYLLPWERGRPYGVVANSDGLWCYPRLAKRRFLHWDEVCLWEVSLAYRNKKPWREYKLYGHKAVARWLELLPSKWVSPGLTDGEFAQRHQALLDLIVARTGLVPRTLDKELAEASGV